LLDDDDLVTSLPLRALTNEIAKPIIEAGQAAGEVRRDVAADEIVDWLLETAFSIPRHHHDEETVRRRLRLFVRPALVHNPPVVATLKLIGRTEQKLKGALELLGELRDTAEPTDGG